MQPDIRYEEAKPKQQEAIVIFPQKRGHGNSEIVYNTTWEEDNDREKKNVHTGVQDRSGPLV
ncbi:MAG: hypothetical protein U9R72_14585, partial [Chloroflexota bacterium]|nr:hypothetical protein [Chloroflexota bacterium]